MPTAQRSPLIVGSGIAGLYVAIRAREAGLNPILVTKSKLEDSNTRYAQGGIAAAIGPGDTVLRHFKDTVRAGDGIVERAAARVLTAEAPARIADLVRYGVPFDTVEGQIALGREGAHSQPRILHAGGDATGLSIEETLKRRATEAGIDARERTVLRRLYPTPEGGVRAILSRDTGDSSEEFVGHPVVLATGGAGSLYRQSSNPSIATGEGVAIAFRAGAMVGDMEFIQFHPTAFHQEGAPRYLITEAIRGEGALLRTEQGDRFMPRYHHLAELAPRDVVSRAIRTEMGRTGSDRVYLDATKIPRERLLTRFPTICRFLQVHGLDPSRDRVPVSPVAHYMIGGVMTDTEGRTSLPGLLACGEVAATGVHGANRLASNSLLEGLVFGERVAGQLVNPTPGGPRTPRKLSRIPGRSGEGKGTDPRAVEEVRDILWTQVGITRDREGLSQATEAFESLRDRAEPASPQDLPGPAANAALTAALIARAALLREESRGAHFRTDFPRSRPGWLCHLGLRLATTTPA
ncbi:MAG TPA: L-aspartate oxidase [Thermoplasmata archaeon]|nr:L-aspartate oxidase [Thermoplasmata archaeon]